jgi:hypothetical protein
MSRPRFSCLGALTTHDAILTTLRASAVAGTMPNHSAASVSVQSSR